MKVTLNHKNTKKKWIFQSKLHQNEVLHLFLLLFDEESYVTFKLNFDLEFCPPPPSNANCLRMTKCHCIHILYTYTLYTYTIIINNQHKNRSKRGPVLVLWDYYTRSYVKGSKSSHSGMRKRFVNNRLLLLFYFVLLTIYF